MPLEAGTRLGPYEIVQVLGAGGMGEVYRARDPRLARDVAIKVLAPHLAQDRDALARFEREAKTASALNHPHIVHIYEIGEAATSSGAVHYIAMELVEGETLRARLKAGARINTLLEPLAQAADALARAHKEGIVHRDLKPENVMITADGYPKILDFGLAKLQEPAADSESPTPAVAGHTRTGTVLGTPGYMSPEQVHGKPADQRSDIFSFGCILYEAATGRQPFRGASSVATLHAIVYDEPPAIESLSPETPEELRRIIGRCLEKSPERRYQAMKEIADVLRALARGGTTPSLDSFPTQVYPGAAVGSRRPAQWLVGTGIAIVAVVGGLYLSRARTPRKEAEPAAARAAIQVEKLTSRGDVGDPALSPDGRYLAYNAASTIWLRDIVEKSEARLVTLPEAVFFSNLRFSKDGRSIYYFLVGKNSSERSLYRMPLIGGEPRLMSSANALAPDERQIAFGRRQAGKWTFYIGDLESGAEKAIAEYDGGLLAWSPDSSKLLFSRDERRSLLVVNSDGSGERKLSELADETRAAMWKPGGTAIVLNTRAADQKSRLVNLDLASGVSKPMGSQSWSDIRDVHWLPDASGLVFTGQGAIWHLAYPEGKAARIPAGTAEYAALGMTADGTKLVALQRSGRSDLLVSSSPEAGAFKKVVSGTDVDYSVCWTADGQIVYSSNEAGSYDLYASDPDGARRKQLTFDRKANETAPAASADGRYIVFASDRTGRLSIDRINRDGTGLVSLTSPTTGRGDYAPHVTPDSRWVFYRGWDNGPTLWKVSIEGGPPTPVIGARTETREEKAFGASVSPDGASLAFFYFALDGPSKTFSRTELVISTLEGSIVKRFPYESPISVVGDHQRVQWSRDGATLYYYQIGAPGNLWKRPVAGGPAVQVTRFEDRLGDFEWSLDGRRLACSRWSSVSDAVLITNFR